MVCAAEKILLIVNFLEDCARYNFSFFLRRIPPEETFLEKKTLPFLQI